MNHPLKPEALAKPSGKLFLDVLVRGRLIDELSCETGGVSQTGNHSPMVWLGGS